MFDLILNHNICSHFNRGIGINSDRGRKHYLLNIHFATTYIVSNHSSN